MHERQSGMDMTRFLSFGFVQLQAFCSNNSFLSAFGFSVSVERFDTINSIQVRFLGGYGPGTRGRRSKCHPELQAIKLAIPGNGSSLGYSHQLPTGLRFSLFQWFSRICQGGAGKEVHGRLFMRCQMSFIHVIEQ